MDRNAARARAEELCSKMTLEEKASQLRYDSPAIERLGVPAYNWWNEALHGVARAGNATMFPQAIGCGATFDEALLGKIAEVIAVEGRAKYNMQSRRGDRDIYKGLTFWSPNVNIFRDPRWGRGHETYGEDPYLTGRLGVSYIKGLQGDGEVMKAAACAKHFAVHSGPEEMRHYFDAKASKKDMEETYLPAFEAAVKEGQVEAVMGAYNRTNGEPCCGSPALQDILRTRWGFKGHFVSDCWAIRDFHENHCVTKSPEESVKLALENGTDVNCGCTYQKILNAVDQGLIDEAVITESAVRLFTCRFMLGLFDETEYDRIPWTVVESRDHQSVADQAAEESMVLLKNNGILPLDPDKLKAVAVVGPNANSRNALIGNYFGTASRYITVLEGIQDLLGDKVPVYYSEGCHLFKDNVSDLSDPEMNDRLAESQEATALSDVCIVVLGLDSTLEGEENDTGNSFEGGDKKNLALPGKQLQLLQGMLDTGKPVIVLNMTGSSVDLSLAEEKAAAILQLWYPGAHGGKTAAELLFGKFSPSGKLPVTFYRDGEDLPEYTDYAMKGRTYRFYDGSPLYPFGYGLTYGKTEALSLEMQIKGEIEKKEGAECAFGPEPEETEALAIVRVRNSGSFDTWDVCQVYVKGTDDDEAIPHPCLQGFQRVFLKAGEEKTLTIPLNPRAFTSVDEEGIRRKRGSAFTVYAGFSQPDERSQELTRTACVSVAITI